MSDENFRQRFIFPEIGVWGVGVRLTTSWQQILDRYEYDAVVGSKLGEAIAATVLLATHLKREGSLILQTQSKGPLHTVVSQCTRNGTIRGLARAHGSVSDGSVGEVFGDGKLVMTIDSDQPERYQGIVALEGVSLGAALENYFGQSEQLATRLWLEADASVTAGLLLQRLPAGIDGENKYASDDDSEHWNRLVLLTDTLRPRELIETPTETLITRLFHQEKVRRYVPNEVTFYCGCSKERIESMLTALGQDEVRGIVAEQGGVEVDCEFCNQHYRFEPNDCEQLFATDEISDRSSPTLH